MSSAPSSKQPAPKPANPQKPEIAPGVFASADTTKWRIAAGAMLLVLLAGGIYFVMKGVKQGQDADRWERLAAITDLRDEGGNDLGASSSPVDVISRDEYIRRLEDFIAREAPDAAATIHAHALVANLQMTQLVSAPSSTKATERATRYAAAASHWKAVKDSGLELPLTANRFRPTDAPRAVDLLLQKLETNRAWDLAHGIRDAEPDADVVVLLRTSEGDLRLRLFSKADQSPALAKAFVERVCRGDYDGTLLFEKRADGGEGWIHGGDPRVKKSDAPATDEARLGWVDAATPGEPILPDAGRHRIAHVQGTVSAWHAGNDPYDDPAQFLLVTKTSPDLDAEFTPFGRVEDASFPVLERLAAARTRADAKPELRLDPKLSKLSDQLETPAVLLKALVYEKGALRACHDAAKVDESERKLDTVKPDALRVLPPAAPAVPAAPDATIAPPTPGTPPAMDGETPK